MFCRFSEEINRQRSWSNLVYFIILTSSILLQNKISKFFCQFIKLHKHYKNLCCFHDNVEAFKIVWRMIHFAAHKIYTRCCSDSGYFRYPHKCLFDRLLSQGYTAVRLDKSSEKFYSRYQYVIEKYRRSVKEMVNDSFPR